MKVVAPITIATGGALTSTNVGTSLDPAAYNAGTTYAQENRCVVGESVYESAAGGNVGHNPPDSPTYWTLVGVINKVAMFDERVGTQTVNADTIEVVINPGVVVDTVSLRNVVGNTVNVRQVDPDEGEVVNKTINLLEDVSGMWDYLYSPIVREDSALILGLLPYRNAAIHITIDNTGGDAKCGSCLIGAALDAGDVDYGASDGIEDYSLIKPDAFGVRSVVQRDFADDMDFTVNVPIADSPRFRRVLTERRALPTLFILADHRPDAQVYGLPSFRRAFQFQDEDVFTVSVKGMT